MKRRYFIPALIILCVVLAIRFTPTPQRRSPEQAWAYVVKCYLHHNPDAASPHLTAEGRKVADWLFAQPWIQKKMAPEILKKKAEANRYEIYLRFKEKDGVETCSLIFHKENDVWKFQDVYLDNLKGARFGMYLSEFIEHPILASWKFAFKNPGLFAASIGQAAGNAITWAGSKFAEGANASVNFVVWNSMKILLPFLCALFIYDWVKRRFLKKN